VKVCVVGSGAREHALAHVLSKSAEVVAAPGNVGIEAEGIDCADAAPEDVAADLYVIGPEQPLVDGLGDRLRDLGRLVFGPSQAGARLEGSKAWMKEAAAAADIPTARHATFAPGDGDQAAAYVRTLPGLYVIKTDYLAAGKGVLVTESLAEAEADARTKLEKGGVVIEEGMRGPELSLLCLCDGKRALPLSPAQDHKRVGDGDTGPNTGGMGAFSPVPGCPDAAELADRFGQPMIDWLSAQGIDYRGVLYVGLMLTTEGPKLVEYNVRFGDPEAQVVLPRMEGDVAALLAGAASGDLTMVDPPRFSSQAAVNVVMAVEGYPVSPRTGDVITGVEDAAGLDGVSVFHAGTALNADGELVAAGGRALSVTALAASLPEARDRAYEAVSRIQFEGSHYRKDIAG
jgi:phosphoribosylamine--glycine ligase